MKELTTFDANTDMIAADFGTAKSTTVAWNFDWTTKKNVTGYFTAKNGVVTAAAGAGTIKASDGGKDYIAVTISAVPLVRVTLSP